MHHHTSIPLDVHDPLTEVFIDKIQMFNIECFSFLNSALESKLYPIIVMASNCSMATIRGTNYLSPHGLPVDLLDRMLIISISMGPYEEEAVGHIVQLKCVATNLLPVYLSFPFCSFGVVILLILPLKCQEEDVSIDSDALFVLTSLALSTTLRYALIVSPAHTSSRENERPAPAKLRLRQRRCWLHWRTSKKAICISWTTRGSYSG